MHAPFQYAVQPQSMCYYPAYRPVPLPDAEEHSDDEPQMADILFDWAGRGSSSRDWESEAHAQYTYASMPQYVFPHGFETQPPPAPRVPGRPAAAERVPELTSAAASAPGLADAASPTIERERLACVETSPRLSSTLQRQRVPAARKARRKPPFHLYGNGNTRPTCGGVVYGDYMATHNANAGLGLQDVDRETFANRGDAQVHFYERDLRRSIAEHRRVDQYYGRPMYDARKYAAPPSPAPEVSPTSSAQRSRGPTTHPSTRPSQADGSCMPPAATCQSPARVPAAAVGATAPVEPLRPTCCEAHMQMTAVPPGGTTYMLPPSVPFVPFDPGTQHNPHFYKTLPPDWLRHIPPAGVRSWRRDNIGW